MSRRGRVTAVLVMVLLLYGAVRLGTGAVVVAIETPYDGNYGEPVEITIAAGDSAAEVAERLQERGVVRSALALRLWLRWNDTAGRIHTGRYRFQGRASLRQVSEIITEGKVLLDSVTVIEGATRWQVAEALAAAGFGAYPLALAATEQAALIADLDAEARDLEGYLFPDTYHAPRGSGAPELVAMMVRQFRNVWTLDRVALAAQAGLTLREVVTIASLVEAETGLPGERTLVSGVYQNRLREGMLLQCDPTLLYALYLDGRRDRNIRRADFDNPSPYNTYRVRGLPPGPIGNPGAASIDAALQPADTEYLYFVGRNDGSHAFARTLREHNANVNRYQR